MTNIDEQVEKIIDEFFVVDGKEHHTRDLEKQIKSLIAQMLEEIVGEHEITPKERGEKYPTIENNYFDGRNNLRNEQRQRAKEMGIL